MNWTKVKKEAIARHNRDDEYANAVRLRVIQKFQEIEMDEFKYPEPAKMIRRCRICGRIDCTVARHNPELWYIETS